MRYGRRDANQTEIVRALRKVGARVIDLAGVGSDCPDILVCYHKRLFTLEIKNPNGLNRMSEGQQALAEVWPVHVVRSIDDALQAIGVTKITHGNGGNIMFPGNVAFFL